MRRALLALAAGLLFAPGAHAQDTPLFPNLGTLHHPVTTSSPRAQAYFDQGLRLTYGFNHEEAVNSFREATRLDPRCAMCYWGIALALGPNINQPMEPESERQAYAAIQAAVQRLEGATPAERGYIRALARRYGDPAGAERARRDSAYGAAMREVALAHPEDLDAATLFAEALLDLRPWNQWTRAGEPQPGTEEVVATLERVLTRDPAHPGACHYYIHTVEGSRAPERALPCAERLPGLMPGAGHLVHMPAHIYMRLGMYDRARDANMHAAHADETYLEGRRPRGGYPFYYAHNLHFLWAAATETGQSGDALRAGRAVAERVPADLARQMPFLEFFTPTPLYALARFGRWQEILREPAPPADLRYARAMWHHARGLALLATSHAAEAAAERDSVVAIRGAVPTDRMMGMHSARTLLEVAERLLSGRLRAAAGDVDGGVGELRRAVELEDGLTYDEPPPWYSPARQALGSVLLRAGRPGLAEAAFREDLEIHRGNAWSLQGLARALRAQGKDAAAVEARLARAWASADVPAPPLW